MPRRCSWKPWGCRRRNDMAYSAEDFVRFWQESETTGEVAKKVGASAAVVSRRAWLYRQKGVPLKKFQQGRRKAINFATLARLAKSLAPKEEEPHAPA